LIRQITARARRARLTSIALLAIVALPGLAVANGSDFAPTIVLQGFVKPEPGRVRLLVRVPLVFLGSFNLPKRGPGYLELDRIDDQLLKAADATGKQIELRDADTILAPIVRKARVSVLADRAFQNYAAALALLEGPKLPVDTDVFWDQGFFDAELEYAVDSPTPRLSVRMSVAPELERRVKLRLEYLPVGGAVRRYEFSNDWSWMPLDPTWYEAAWIFAWSGFGGAFALDRFVFLLCLVAPFRQYKGLLAVVLVMTGLQALTLTAGAVGAIGDIHWLPSLYASGVAFAILLLALGNLSAPRLARRWFIAAVVGALAGFGVGRALSDQLQFAGAHALASVLSFNVGLAAGEILMLSLAYAALRALFSRVLGPLLGVAVLSAVLGHIAWHWMIDAGHALGHAVAEEPSFATFVAVARWLVPALIVGGIAFFLPKRFGGDPVTTLRSALLGRDSR
jgi:hypothetical protein